MSLTIPNHWFIDINVAYVFELIALMRIHGISYLFAVVFVCLFCAEGKFVLLGVIKALFDDFRGQDQTIVTALQRSLGNK